MKSLSELADAYEKWATEDEARADEILAAQDSYAYEVPEHQLARANQLIDEAATLKKRAAELRKLEQRRSMYCLDPTTLPVKRGPKRATCLVSTRYAFFNPDSINGRLPSRCSI